MLSLCTHLSFADEVQKDGGELLKALYENDIKSEEVIDLEDEYLDAIIHYSIMEKKVIDYFEAKS